MRKNLSKCFLLFFIVSCISAASDDIEESIDQLDQVMYKVKFLETHDEDPEESNYKILNEALNIFEKFYERRIYNESSFLVKICITYFKSEDSTLNFFEKFLDLVYDFQDAKSPKLSDILNTIGLVYFEGGKRKRAEKYFIKSIKLSGLKELKKAPIFYKLAIIQESDGDYKGALVNFEKAYEIYKDYKLEHEKTLYPVLNYLGIISGRLGLYQNALKYHNMVLDWSLKKLDQDDDELSNIINNIALIYVEMKDFEVSLEMFDKVLEINKKHSKPMDKTFATTYYNIGTVYFELDKLTESHDYFEKALKIYEYNYGEGHLITADTLSNLGLIMNRNGDIKGALKHMNKALNIIDLNLEPGHFKSWNLLGNIGDIYKDLDLHDKALEMYGRQFEIYRKNYEGQSSPPHINPCDPLYNLGLVNIMNLGQFEKTIGYFEKCLKIREELYNGELDDFGLSIVKILEQISEDVGDNEKAKNIKKLINLKNIKSEL